MAKERFLDWQEGMMPELEQVLGWRESAKAKGAQSLLTRTADALLSAPNNLHKLHASQGSQEELWHFATADNVSPFSRQKLP